MNSRATDTEQRKLKYDFATYRQDNLAFETLATSNWTFTGDYQALAGKKISVSAGTNQEKILLEWRTKLQAQGKDFDVEYYPDTNAAQLALESGKIDAYFTPNPAWPTRWRRALTPPTPSAMPGLSRAQANPCKG